MSTATQQQLVNIEIKSPATVFVPGGLDSVIAAIEEKARQHVPDLSTAKSRKAIASIASQVARSKTWLDGMGKDLTADLKKQVGAVDAERKQMRDRLDALKIEVRAPLTEWEDTEKERVAQHSRNIHEIRNQKDNLFGLTAADIQARVDIVEGVDINEDDWEEFIGEAAQAKDETRKVLKEAHATVKAAEEKAAEDERRRTEAEKKAQQEREARIAAEAAEKARREAEERSRKKIEDAERKAEQERLKALEAEQKAQREAEEKERLRQIEIEAAKAAEADKTPEAPPQPLQEDVSLIIGWLKHSENRNATEAEATEWALSMCAMWIRNKPEYQDHD